MIPQKICKFVAVQKCENIVDLEKPETMNIWTQKSALIQPRTSHPKFDLPACLGGGPSINYVGVRGEGLDEEQEDMVANEVGTQLVLKPRVDRLDDLGDARVQDVELGEGAEVAAEEGEEEQHRVCRLLGRQLLVLLLLREAVVQHLRPKVTADRNP